MLLKYRTVLYLLACLFCCGQAWAQSQQHYVYIQSEKGQPFYVKVNGQVLSSTERGYIILPRLENGTVPISVGYAQSEGPAQEQKFYVRISKNDQGFLLKKGALYNLQTFREIKADNGDGSAATAAAQEPVTETVAANNTSEDTARKEMMGNLQKELETTFAQKATVTGPGKPSSPKAGNSFSSALDKVVVSGSDRDEPAEEVAPAKPAQPAAVPAEEAEVKKPKGKKHKGEREPLTDEEQAILKSVMAEESKSAASEAAVEDQPKQQAEEEQPAPKKQKKHRKREGDPDFIEFQDESKPVAAAAVPAPVAAAPVEAATSAVDLPATEEAPSRKKKKRKLFDDTEHPNNIITDSSGYGVAVGSETPAKSRKKKHDETMEETAEKKNADTRLINTDCGNIMDDGTFRKVLRKFAGSKSDDGMIDVFRRSTRNYCLETAQIKTLAQLMSTDEARYRLLDMAYAKTYDTEKYGSLESLLTEGYYKGRFKAMLHK